MTPTPASPAPSSLHYDLVSRKLPTWAGQSSAEDHRSLRQAGTTLLPWLRQAARTMPDVVQAFKREHALWRSFKKDLDGLMPALPALEHFAAPLLSSAIKERFGVSVDVRRACVFNASLTDTRINFEGISDDPVVELHMALRRGTHTLLNAALQNFPQASTVRGGMDLPGRAPAAVFAHDPIRDISVTGERLPSIPAHDFATLCRELDLGAKYQKLIDDTLHSTAAPDSSDATTAQAITDARRKLEGSTLKLEAHVACMKGTISRPFHQCLLQVASNQPARQGGRSVTCSFLKLWDTELQGPLIIGPDRDGATDTLPILAYIPGDPQSPLKEYPSTTAFSEDLRDKLLDDSYRSFFQQFMPEAKRASLTKKILDCVMPYTRQGAFLTPGWAILKRTRDPKAKLHLREDIDPRPLFEALLGRKDASLRANAAFHAVATAEVDARTLHERILYFASLAFTFANVAAFVVPVIGQAMLLINVAQLAYETYEGIDAWSKGEQDEAWGYLVDVLENVATIALLASASGGAPIPATEQLRVETPSFIEDLGPVQMPDGQPRLWKPDIAPFAHDILLPADLRPDEFGLYHYQDKTWLALEDKLYCLEQPRPGGEHRLVHPSRDDAYQPVVRHNGAGAWLHELDRPGQWQGTALIQRAHPAAARLPASLRQRVLEVSGVHELELRQTLSQNQRPSGLLLDTLARFRLDEEIVGALPDASSAERNAEFSRRYAALVGREVPGSEVMTQHYPELPNAVVEEIARQASADEQVQLHNREIPLRMLLELEACQDELRLSRAYEGLFLSSPPHTADTGALVLHSVHRLPGWQDDVRLEIRDLSRRGRLLSSVGDEAAPIRKVMVYANGGYEAFDHDDLHLHGHDTIYASILHALPDAQRNALGFPGTWDSARLQQTVLEGPLLPRQALRRALGLQITRHGSDPEMGLARGREVQVLTGAGTGLILRESLLDMLRWLRRDVVFGQTPDAMLAALEAAGLDNQQIFQQLSWLLDEYQDLRSAMDAWGEQSGQRVDPLASADSRRRTNAAIWQFWHASYLPQIQPSSGNLYLFNVDLADFPQQLPTFVSERVDALHLLNTRLPDSAMDIGEPNSRALLQRFPNATTLVIDGQYFDRTGNPLPGSEVSARYLLNDPMLDASGWSDVAIESGSNAEAMLTALDEAGLDATQINHRIAVLSDESARLQTALDGWEPARQTAQATRERNSIRRAIWTLWLRTSLSELASSTAELRLEDVDLVHFPGSLPDFLLQRVGRLTLTRIAWANDTLSRLLEHFPQASALVIDGAPGMPQRLWNRTLTATVARSLPNLRELSLLDQGLRLDATHFQDISALSRLEHLDLSGNTLASELDAPFSTVLAGMTLSYLGLERMNLQTWPSWLTLDRLQALQTLSLRGNTLYTVPAALTSMFSDLQTVIRLQGNPLSEHFIREWRLDREPMNYDAFPRVPQPDRGARLELDISPELEVRLTRLETERDQLRAVLDPWATNTRPAPLPMRSLMDRRLICTSIAQSWRAQVRYDLQGLSLVGVDLAQFPPRLPAFFTDRITNLTLWRSRTQGNALDTTLRMFPRVEVLTLSELGQAMPSIPMALLELPRLISLNLENNGLLIEEPTLATLARIPGLVELNLSGNRIGAIGAQAGLPGNLRILNLRANALDAWPAWVDRLPSLDTLELDDNGITTLPEHIRSNPPSQDRHTTISLLNNPLDYDTLQDISENGYGSRTYTVEADLPDELQPEQVSDHSDLGHSSGSDDYVSTPDPEEVPNLETWLTGTPEQITRRRQVWQQLSGDPQAQNLMGLVGRMTGTSAYRSGSTRSALVESVWAVLETAASTAEQRDLFNAIASDALLQPGTQQQTCHDGVWLVFNQIERQLYISREVDGLPEAERGPGLLRLATRLYRLERLDQLAREQAGNRDEAEVRLAYRLYWADSLELPLPPQNMLYRGVARATTEELDTARRLVRDGERGEELLRFAAQQPFWTDYLRDSHAGQFSQLEDAYQAQVLDLPERYPERSIDQLGDEYRSLEADYQHQVQALIHRLTIEQRQRNAAGTSGR